MDKPEIVQLVSYPGEDNETLAAEYTVHRCPPGGDGIDFLRSHAQEARAVATHGGYGCSADVIAALPKLEIIAIYGVGFDRVDLDAAAARGVRVTNTPDVLTDDCADLALALMLAQNRSVVAADAWVRGGHWGGADDFPLQRSTRGKRAGVFGLGRIGIAVAERLAPFGLEIGYGATAPKPHASQWRFFEDPVALADWADFLFVTLAASAATRGIVNRDVIKALGPQGMLINISRGSTVDEAALLDALETGALGSAALDVFENEPTPDRRFLSLPNVLLQPHVASATVETRAAMGRLMRDNLAAHFAGEPLPSPIV